LKAILSSSRRSWYSKKKTTRFTAPNHPPQDQKSHPPPSSLTASHPQSISPKLGTTTAKSLATSFPLFTHS
jgi:hypothetical protein